MRKLIGLLLVLGAGYLTWLKATTPPPDFSILDGLLHKYVDTKGRIDYAGWKAHDEPELDRFLEVVARARPGFYARDQAFAFWINAYNACVIKKILAKWPVEQVSKLPDFFKEKGLAVAGQDMCLDDIEHKHVRKEFSDARCHFALVCGAKSCPRLLDRAYQAEGLDAELTARAREFVNDDFRNVYDAKAGAAHVSEIFKWFSGDFEREGGTVIGFLRIYATPEHQAVLERKDLKLDCIPYNLELNKKGES
jgi:hypothetical protein